jgi:outer membrane protein OmpA-like peptidoglycan-associated protein
MKTSHLTASALPALLFALAAMSIAPASLAQEEAPNRNVIVNDSALDDLPAASEEDLLPAPELRPISRLLISPSGKIVGTADLGSSPEAASLAAPTTPIQSTELDEPGAESEPATEPGAESEPTVETATATPPAETAAGELPEEAAATEGMLDGQIRIPYDEETDNIPEADKGRIVGLIEKLNSDYGLHLQVLAYASGDDDEIGRARGVSLARALAMRNFLVENGLDLSRMEVRALGNTAQEDPADRVDLIPLIQ